MRFSVRTADETETPFEGRYKINDSGVLVITPDDQREPKVTLSPGWWREISEENKASNRGLMNT